MPKPERQLHHVIPLSEYLGGGNPPDGTRPFTQKGEEWLRDNGNNGHHLVTGKTIDVKPSEIRRIEPDYPDMQTLNERLRRRVPPRSEG